MAAPWFEITPKVFRGGRWRPAEAADRAAPSAAAAPTSLTLLTWNVWFARHRHKQRTAALLDELAWRAPDVVALQEVTPELLEPLTQSELVRANYQLTDSDGATFERYGVLLLAKLPIQKASILELPSQMGRRLLIAELANGLCVATVHLESTSQCVAARVEQLGIIQTFLAARYPEIVLMGDMNFTPEAPAESAAVDPAFIDAWRHNRFHDPGYTVDGLRNLMRQHAYADAAQRRIDRVFIKGTQWKVEDISLTGVSPIDDQGTCISDHFGLETVLQHATSEIRS